MSAGTIIFWRHGRTEYNAAGRLQGQSDIPLDDTGPVQAREAGERLVELHPSRIITSDLQRARDTAEVLGRLAGVEVEDDKRLRERSFGRWEGLRRSEIAEHWPEAFAAWRRGAEPEGIEADTRRQTAARVHGAVVEHVARLAPEDVLVVVSHGAAIGLGITALLGLDPQTWFGLSGLDNCSWSIVSDNRGRKPGWRLQAHNVSS